ncbi:MAG: hypothetical protein KF774_07425 [Planctomyces sp.]|nr:hypothetical protein [Planctomyces sp.]
MSTFNFSIPLGSVDLDKLETDADYRREAQRLLPDALTRIGEKTAEVAWTELQKSFRGIPGFKGNSSSSDKSRFIQEGGQNHRRNASAQDRREVEKHIIEELKEIKRRTE